MRPLVELHLHLDGSLRLETMLEIGAREGIALPGADKDELYRALRCGEIRHSLDDYLMAFGTTVSVMQSAEALFRVSSELIEDVAKDGIKYVEVRFMPELHTVNGLRGDDVMQAVLEGLELGGLNHHVDWGLIICSMRHVSPEVTGRMIDLAIRYRDCGVVAVDLAGDDNLPALDHAPHFLRAKDKGLHVTIHAAEEGPAERAIEAIERFGAERLGHAVQALKRKGIMDRIHSRGVGIESCLTSNLQTKVVPSYEEHPARHYARQGLLSLSCDNRMLAHTSLENEFWIARSHWDGYGVMGAYRLIWNAIQMSFAPAHVKAALHRELDRM